MQVRRLHVKSEKVRKPRSRIVRVVGPIKSVQQLLGSKVKGENDNDDRNGNGNDNELAAVSTFAEYSEARNRSTTISSAVPPPEKLESPDGVFRKRPFKMILSSESWLTSRREGPGPVGIVPQSPSNHRVA